MERTPEGSAPHGPSGSRSGGGAQRVIPHRVAPLGVVCGWQQGWGLYRIALLFREFNRLAYRKLHQTIG